MEILLIFIILFFILPRILLRLATWWLRRKAKRTFEDFASQFESQARQAQQARQPERPAKKYAASDGEYIDYEEIAATETQTTEAGTETTYTATEQIVDVEWEDVK